LAPEHRMGNEERAYKNCGSDQVMLVLNVNGLVRSPYDQINYEYEAKKITSIYKLNGKVIGKVIRKYQDTDCKILLSEELK
jgi:hypothetical protein